MVDDDVIPAAMRTSWAESERRLYPLATSDTSRYERIIVVVRAVADELRSVASTEQLVALWPNARELVASAATARGLSVSSLPDEHIAGAAFVLREGELKAQRHRQSQEDRIGVARLAGQEWVVLDERGDVDAGLVDPYQCTEMHVASGLALVSLVQLDPSQGIVNYVVAVIQLDPLSGQLIDAEPGIADWEEHDDREAFVAHREAVRRRVGLGNIAIER